MNPTKGGLKLSNLYREEIYLPYAVAVFEGHFGGSDAFANFYGKLTDENKDLFLGVASKYVFLVKNGDWHVEIKDCNPVIDYLTNSFKLVSIFALIESLSSEKHEDFYDWLRKKEHAVFPITDTTHLRSLQDEYKTTYGSIRRCVQFFQRLPESRQAQLRLGFISNGNPAVDIKAVAQFLYNLRSKFVHEGEFVLDVAATPVISRHKNASTLTSISMPVLLSAFEEGVVAYFTLATQTN
ncbi:hypothetical protein ACFFKC_05825 [Pseudoduganella danionis]|uniref:Apea-like HEPN domain-containing protein n=1 Tax=Pseudoduganella danionis TaxID=1890295 RepID=A0ABW9SRP8_9BURK|nr:hypothetical protein [Pseudoduganella danionis]MTW34279.1 hypothetical protein [Pseudoduganella danionis]